MIQTNVLIFSSSKGNGGGNQHLSQIILGIDPGSLRTGFGAIRMEHGQWRALEYGVLQLPPEETLAQRLALLNSEMQKLLSRLKPSVVAVEKVFLGRNADSAFKLGHARGVAMALAALSGAEVVEYAARVVKKVVTGSGAAGKDQVQMLVLNSLGVRSQKMAYDATDALALALCHAQTFEVKARVKRLMESAL